MKARVDPDLCVGSGLCEETCPRVFELRTEVAEVIGDEVPAEAEEACRQARDNCPSGAISIEE